MMRTAVRAPSEDAVSKIKHFAAYAAAFEKSFLNDDWSLVEPFFAEDALYVVSMEPPMGGRFEGRTAILRYFKDVLDSFDRHFESREVALLKGPTEKNDSVWFRGSATYRAAGVPDFYLELEETAFFEGDRIRRLEDQYEPEMKQRIAAYLAEYGMKLGITIANGRLDAST